MFLHAGAYSTGGDFKEDVLVTWSSSTWQEWSKIAEQHQQDLLTFAGTTTQLELEAASALRIAVAPPAEVRSLPEIEVDTELLQARYGNKPYRVTYNQAIGLKALLDAKGDWVSWSKQGISKPSETKNSLPEDLKALIETSSGKGYRFKRLP
jgi:hypothetical protein